MKNPENIEQPIDLSSFNADGVDMATLNEALEQARTEKKIASMSRKNHPETYHKATVVEYKIREQKFLHQIGPIQKEIKAAISSAQEAENTIDTLSEEDRASIAKRLSDSYKLIDVLEQSIFAFQNRGVGGEKIETTPEVQAMYKEVAEDINLLKTKAEELVKVFDPQADLAAEELNDLMQDLIKASKKAA